MKRCARPSSASPRAHLPTSAGSPTGAARGPGRTSPRAPRSLEGTRRPGRRGGLGWLRRARGPVPIAKPDSWRRWWWGATRCSAGLGVPCSARSTCVAESCSSRVTRTGATRTGAVTGWRGSRPPSSGTSQGRRPSLGARRQRGLRFVAGRCLLRLGRWCLPSPCASRSMASRSPPSGITKRVMRPRAGGLLARRRLGELGALKASRGRCASDLGRQATAGFVPDLGGSRGSESGCGGCGAEGVDRQVLTPAFTGFAATLEHEPWASVGKDFTRKEDADLRVVLEDHRRSMRRGIGGVLVAQGDGVAASRDHPILMRHS